jgi:hypothetical protein
MPSTAHAPTCALKSGTFSKALYSVNPGDALQLAEIAHDMQRLLTP